MQLDKDSPIPLYHQLKEELTKMIERKYSPGDLIPTESEIEELFSVSRMTVRLAVNTLVEEGLVIKRQGKGTFVQSPKITHSLSSITSWTQEMLDRSLTPKTLTTEYSEMVCPRKIAQLLKLTNPEQQVIRLKRIRYANDEPMCIMINYLVKQEIPGFNEQSLKGESLYKVLAEKYGVIITKAQETVEAREASEYEAEVLQIEPYAPVLFVTRLSYLPSDKPFEVVQVTSRADRYQYQMMLHGRKGD